MKQPEPLPSPKMPRRNFISLSVWSAVAAAGFFLGNTPLGLAEEIVKMEKKNDEWRKVLTPDQFDVLRKEGTEAPFTSPLLREHRVGTFACAACGLALFDSSSKFDSGTGWPSFFKAIPQHVETKTDFKIGFPRTEYHCARCGGHQGHVFNDGPAITGLRYCNNGVALKFEPEKG